MTQTGTATRKVTFITINGKVNDWPDEDDARQASAYVARSTKSARRAGSDRVYAVVSYKIPVAE